MAEGSLTTIAIVVSIGGVLSLLLAYRIYHQLFRRKKRAVPALENRQAAFSVGGNLVRELTSPITDTYSMTKTLLGRGSSAEVVIGEHIKNKRRYAIKIIDISKKEVVWRYDREKNFLKDIDHTNVVRLYEVYTAPTAMFFVMELCTGGHLGHVLKQLPHNRFDEKQARTYVLQILRALVHLHERGICHRDIKLQNVLLENHTPEAQVKVIDLGNAVRYRGHTPLTKVVGTTYTAAPEVFRKSYDERCDSWSLGVVTYILLSGRRPFERVELAPTTKAKESSVIASILMGRYHFKHDVWQKVSNDAIDFIKTCLELDYTKRAYPSELMNHPWFVFNKGTQGLSALGKTTLTSMSYHHDLTATPDHLNPNPNPSDNNSGDINLFASSSNNISNYAFTLKSSSNRHLLSSRFGGMRHTSMLAVAFAMPISKARQLRDLFQEIDRNGNGTIEKEEFRVAFQQVHPELAVKDIDMLFDIIDQDGSKSISFLEFVAATIDPRDVDVKEMNQAFKILDRDQKGYLTREDLLRVLSTVPYEEFSPNSTGVSQYNNGAGNSGSSLAYGNTMSMDSNLTAEEEQCKLNEAHRIQKIQEKIEKIMDAADVNKDGVISYTEFLFAMAEGSLGLFDNTNAETLANAPPLLQSNYGSLMQYPFRKKATAINYNRRQSDGAVLFQPNAFRKITPEQQIHDHAESMPHTSSAASSGGFMNSFSSSISSLMPLTVRSYFTNNKDRVELIGKGLEPAENIDDSPMYGDIEHGSVHLYASQRDLPASATGSQHEAYSNHNMSEDQNNSATNDHSFQSTPGGSSMMISGRPAPMLSATNNRALSSPALLASLKINDKMKNKERKKRLSYHFSRNADQAAAGPGNNLSLLQAGTSPQQGGSNAIKRAISDDDDDPEVSSMSAYMGTELRLLSQKASSHHKSMDETQMRKTIFSGTDRTTAAVETKTDVAAPTEALLPPSEGNHFGGDNVDNNFDLV